MVDTQAKDAKKVIEIPGGEEVSKSFLEYSMSVVYSRAIPSATDGLKPVQRRLLYAMWLDGFTNEKSFVKSARPVSSCMGTYHPHGDSSIYEALVKLVQPFYLNVPLVEGYGNFGDISGSGAAASRYTEAKLSKAAHYMLQEVKEDTVDMKPNYDGETVEPVALPAMFPALLINGNFGIGVGFASKLASHNPGEAINAVKMLIKNPDASLKQIMKVLPGPDFPTGAQILGTDGIKEAYKTGQGIIRLQAKATISPTVRGKHEIIFTELPYGIKTESIIAKIKELLKVGKLAGVADAKDLTDMHNGLRIVVETKTGVNPNGLLAELYKETPLSDSFGINNTVLVNGEPKTINLLEMIDLFIEQRVDVITRRSVFRRDKKESRLHLIEGLLKALANIDEVIRIVRNSKDASFAQQGLIKKFKIDETQADYILGIALRRLTKFDQLELTSEKQKLVDEIKKLNEIINNPEVLKQVMLIELEEVKKIIDHPRRSEIIGGNLAEHLEAVKQAVANVALDTVDEPCGVFLSAKGEIVRSSKINPSKPVLSHIETNTQGKFIAISSKGKAFRLDVVLVGTKESPVSTILPEKLSDEETIIALAPLNLPEGSTGGLALGTKNGTIKIVTPTWPVRSDEFSVIALEGEDEIVGARWVEDINNYEFTFIANNANLLRFEANKVRPQGLSGAGMAGIKLVDNSTVTSFNAIRKDEIGTALVITCTGKTVKATPYALFSIKGRGSQGMRSHKFLKGENGLILTTVSPSGILFTADGTIIGLPKIDNRRDGSGISLKREELF